jgi:hypothetical protein
MELKFVLEMLFCTFFKEIQESSPLYACIQYVQPFVCENMNYKMHLTEESQPIRLEKHMLSLPKPDSPIWQTRPSDFARQNQ